MSQRLSNLRKYRPQLIRACTLFWTGYKLVEIAALLRLPPNTVEQILETPDAAEILEELRAKTIDTAAEVQTAANAYAPACLDAKFHLAMNENIDPRVRNIAMTDVLALAGHTPVRRVQLERTDAVLDKYDKMSDAELQEAVAAELLPSADPNPTVH